MTILTAAEAANTIRTSADDPAMLDLLESVDDYIKNATGRDWASDATINRTAKSAARMLLAMWYDNPSMQNVSTVPLSAGLTAALTQLEALVLRYKTFAGLSGAGAVSLPGAQVGDTVATLVGLIGVSGDQSSKFEAVITVTGQLQQVSSDDLSSNYYRALLIPVESL